MFAVTVERKIKDNCHLGDQTVNMWSKQLSETSPHGGCLLWGWGGTQCILSKHYIAVETKGLRGRIGRSFDISGTASVDNSYGPDL